MKKKLATLTLFTIFSVFATAADPELEKALKELQRQTDSAAHATGLLKDGFTKRNERQLCLDLGQILE